MRLFIFLTILCVFTAFYGYSQPGNPGGGGTPVPITGIEYLVGLGALLGFKKIMKSFSKKD
jgi:hypothetical protein